MKTRLSLAATAAVTLATAFLTAPAAAGTPLPELKPQLFEQALAGLPNATVTGAQVQVSGPAGQWSGGVAVPAHGRFRVASVTKAFTAVVALQLVAERRLDLRQTVQHYLPGELACSARGDSIVVFQDHGFSALVKYKIRDSLIV